MRESDAASAAGRGHATGLSGAEATRRLAHDGPNILPTPPRRPAWRRLLAEMVHFFALMFWVAGALALIAGLPQLSVAIFVVILLNGIFAFVQEERAEHAAERLRDLLPRRVTVVRDGERSEIAATDLVVEDLVVLAEGDRISADLRLRAVHALALDTSPLTGESVSTHPSIGDIAFAGCFVVEGEGEAVVTAIGAETRLAGIAGLTSAQHRAATPLRHELDRVSRLIALIAIAVGVGFFAVSLGVGMDGADGFVFAVGVTVAVVPCGLLPTVSLSLAMGAQSMAKRHALVRHLEAVETLGSTTFICTDKTGTLTQNRMAVVEVWMPGAVASIDGIGYEPRATVSCRPEDAAFMLQELARVAVHCSNGRIVERGGQWSATGDPMEAAIDAFAHRVGVDERLAPLGRPERARYPFDARRRRMSVLVGDQLFVKGAPDAVLPVCPDAGADASEAVHRLAARGLRVLAVARRQGVDEVPPSAEDAEEALTLVGLLALEDPPRPGAGDAIAACRRAGVRVAMVTGDHPATALAIASEIGLRDRETLLLTGAELPQDLTALGQLIDHDGVVLARVSPEDKLRIAQALRGRGHVVAMTGDGVNDAPALREAAIGVAMGRSGTDVAREAADLVLLDDDFATIVVAIRHGRATFVNIRRFLTYHLTDNVAELAPFVVWALSAGRFPLAIGVLQVLALDIGTDVLPALALGAEPPSEHVLDRPPSGRHLLDGSIFARAFGILGPVEALFELTAFVVTFVAFGWRPGSAFPEGDTLLMASGAAFTAVVLGQAANAFACRSTRRMFWQKSLRSNRLLVMAVVAQLAMLATFLYLPPLADLLGQAPPSAAGFAVACSTIVAVLAADTIQKTVVRRRHPIDSLATDRAA